MTLKCLCGALTAVLFFFVNLCTFRLTVPATNHTVFTPHSQSDMKDPFHLEFVAVFTFLNTFESICNY